MWCFSDVLKKTLPPDVFGDVLEKVKHLTNDASNDVSRPALIAAGHLMVMIIIQFDLHFEARTVPLISILETKDPGNHGPLILQPMFVGIFEQFVVLSELDN